VSPSPAQPGQDVRAAGPLTAVEVTADATRSGAALVPHVQGSPSILFTLSVSPRVAFWHSGTGLALSACQLEKVLIVTSVGTQGCGAGGLPDPRSAYSLPAWLTSPFGHLTPSGRCVRGRRGDRQTDGSCSDVKQRRGSESGACERPGEKPRAGDRARSTFVSLLMEQLAGRHAERARSPLLKHC